MDHVPMQMLRYLRARHRNEATAARLRRDHRRAALEDRWADMYDRRIRHAAGEPWHGRRKMQDLLAKRLRQARKAAKLTQEKAAVKTGVCKDIITQWERGLFIPMPYSLLWLSKVYGVTVDWLCGLEEPNG